MNSIKEWLLEVGIKKFGPSAIRAGLSALIVWVLAHQGMLETFGIFYDQVTNIISIHLDTLSGSLDLLLLGSIGGLVKVLNYHAAEAVAKE